MCGPLQSEVKELFRQQGDLLAIWNVTVQAATESWEEMASQGKDVARVGKSADQGVELLVGQDSHEDDGSKVMGPRIVLVRQEGEQETTGVEEPAEHDLYLGWRALSVKFLRGEEGWCGIGSSSPA
jgi:hypothetical protein